MLADPALPAAVAEVVVDLPDARSLSVNGVVTWSRREHPFAILGEQGIELRLEPAISEAAIRTPDAAPSPRGPEWVSFNPREVDEHASDRLRAWLQLGYRLAGE